MKIQKLASIIATTFFILVIPLAVPAQDTVTQNRNTKHHHYVVIDVGSFGGPDSIVYEVGVRYLNNHGNFTGCADTPNLDPNNPQNPYFLYPDFIVDPYIQHSFRWELGEITDLGTFPGGTSSCTQWISDRGWIVGGATNGKIDLLAGYPEVNAALWRNGQIHNLGTFGGNQSQAWSVNDHGQVVGFSANTIPDLFASGVFAWGANQTHAFLWQSGRMLDLGTLGGPDSDALLINERGQIAGMSTTTSAINPNTQLPTIDPFLWENGKMIDLGTLGGTYGYPNSINKHGQIVGFSDTPGDLLGHGHPFLWENGVLKDLGTLGGSAGESRSINDAGDAAGYATLPGDQVVHATLWTKGKIIDLGATADYPCSYANGISPRGQVLGALQFCPNNAPRLAFLWEHGDLVKLNSLIPPGSQINLGAAINANELGEIVADGTLPNGETHAVLLIPCDEDHPDLEGCDYTLVDAANVTTADPAHAIRPASAPTGTNGVPMTRRRSRFGSFARPQ
jgi:probable HAF family extracellular repeat protein